MKYKRYDIYIYIYIYRYVYGGPARRTSLASRSTMPAWPAGARPREDLNVSKQSGDACNAKKKGHIGTHTHIFDVHASLLTPQLHYRAGHAGDSKQKACTSNKKSKDKKDKEKTAPEENAETEKEEERRANAEKEKKDARRKGKKRRPWNEASRGCSSTRPCLGISTAC